MKKMNTLRNSEHDSVDLLLKDIFAWADCNISNGNSNYKLPRPRRPRPRHSQLFVETFLKKMTHHLGQHSIPALDYMNGNEFNTKIEKKSLNSITSVKCFFFATFIWTIVLLLLCLCFVIVVSLSLICVIQTGYEEKESFFLSVQVLNYILRPITSKEFNISSHLMNLNSYLMRLFRLISLNFKFNKWMEPYPLRGLDDRVPRNIMCAVSNPLYVSFLEYMCTMCDGIEYILTPKFGTKPQALSQDLFITDWPVIFRGWANKVSLQELRVSIAENSKILQLEGFATNFISSLEYLTKIEHLGNEKVIFRLQADEFTHVIWTSEHYRTSYILRKLFPRPQLIPQDTPVSLRSILLVNGQSAPSFRMPVGRKGLMLYTQSSGSRYLVLKPKEHCITACQTLTARLTAGDIMLVNQTVWEVFSFSSGTLTSISLVRYLDEL